MNMHDAYKFIHSIVEGINHPVVVVDQALKVMVINKSAAKLLLLKPLINHNDDNFDSHNGIKASKTRDVLSGVNSFPLIVLAQNAWETIISGESIDRQRVVLPVTSDDGLTYHWEVIYSAEKICIQQEMILFTFHHAQKWSEIDASMAYHIPMYDHKLLPPSADELFRNEAYMCHSLFEHAPFELLLAKPDGRVIYANPLAQNTLSTVTDKLEGRFIYDFNPIITEEWWNEQFNVLAESKTLQVEYKLWGIEESRSVSRTTMFLLENQFGKCVCLTNYDNHDEYKIKETLLKESRKNESLAEISNELSFHNSLESIVILVRQYALEITESPFCFIVYEDPASNQKVSSIYSDSSENYKNEAFLIESSLKHHYDRLNLNQDDLRSVYSQVMNDKDSFELHEISFLNSVPFSRVAWTGIFFHEGYKGLLFVAGKNSDYLSLDLNHLISLANLFGVAVNRIQEKIRLLNKMGQLELALDVANMGVWNIYPTEGKLVFDQSSQKLISRIGFPVEMDFLVASKCIHPEDLEKTLLSFREHVNSNSSSFRCALRIKNNKKEYWWYEICGKTVSRTKTGDIERITGVIMDINNTMVLTQQLIQSKEEAVMANRAKGAFLARISHEIRTPLNAIIGFSDLLLDKYGNSEQENYLQNIKTSGVKLITLINDVLDLAKIESGMLVLKPKFIELKSIVAEVHNMLGLLADHKKLEFRITLANQLPDFYLLDETQFRQILINLLSNAIKFTENGYVELKIDGVYFSETEFDMTIVVSDTGIGIKPESQVTIFDDFTQQEDQDNRRYGGTGLGLGIVKRLVGLMDGSIQVDSIPGRGSQFKILLPRVIIKIKHSTDNTVQDQSSSIILTSFSSKNQGRRISEECHIAFQNQLKNEWDQFSIKPSFNRLPIISNKLIMLANQCNDQIIIQHCGQLNESHKTFDVEKLNQTISEINDYIK